MSTVQIVLDTETTGLSVEDGDRIIEIGCIELQNRRRTGDFQRYFNPDRKISPRAYEIHKISNEMVAKASRFEDLAEEIRNYLCGNELIIHNASFDIGFLEKEFELAGMNIKIRDICPIIHDTMQISLKERPGSSHSLDALCRFYRIDLSKRKKEGHGAMLDAELLADVWLGLTAGQDGLDFQFEAASETATSQNKGSWQSLRVVKPSPQELVAHEEMLDMISNQLPQGDSVWRKLEGGSKEPAAESPPAQ